MKRVISELEKRLGYQFKDTNLIIEALTHKSFKKSYNNERLEFLGDAVLDLIIGEYLFKKFKDSNEGELSKLRASLVNEEGFAKLAKQIDLGECIFISLAEENNSGRQKPSLISNAFEAVMGAIYLESGLYAVRDIVLELIERTYPKIELDVIFKDYKTTLQELTQSEFATTPKYTMVGSSGPDHKKEFEIEVSINENTLAIAKGKSKKSAQQEAAKKALKILKKENNA